jgi:hypothetical protein
VTRAAMECDAVRGGCRIVGAAGTPPNATNNQRITT